METPASFATLAIGVEVCQVVNDVRTTSGLLVTIADVAAFMITSGTFACSRSGVTAMASGVK
ncbi:hypothetical protein D3C72_2366290 [compost metagenome]